jgi:hypothetical protein
MHVDKHRQLTRFFYSNPLLDRTFSTIARQENVKKKPVAEKTLSSSSKFTIAAKFDPH